MRDRATSGEDDILEVLDALDEATDEFGKVAEEAAIAEHKYKARLHRSIVVLAESGTMADGRKSTADWRNARAAMSAEDEELEYRMADARMRALRESIQTKRSRLDALRTFAANVRSQSSAHGG